MPTFCWKLSITSRRAGYKFDIKNYHFDCRQ